MHFRKYGNLYAGLMFLAFTIVFAVQVPAIRITRVSLVDSAVYPKVLLAALGALSCAQIWLSVRGLRRAGTGGPEGDGKKKDYMCVLRTLFLSIVYVILLEPLGFLISSALYIFCQMLNLCPKDEVSFIKFAVIAVVSSIIIYITFRNGLHLMLPAGPLEGFF